MFYIEILTNFQSNSSDLLSNFSFEERSGWKMKATHWANDAPKPVSFAARALDVTRAKAQRFLDKLFMERLAL